MIGLIPHHRVEGRLDRAVRQADGAWLLYVSAGGRVEVASAHLNREPEIGASVALTVRRAPATVEAS